MSCINELLSKNCVPLEFEEFLLKLFQQTFQLLQRITKDTGAQAVDNLLYEQDDRLDVLMINPFTPNLIINAQILLTIQEQMYEWCSENW